MEHAGGKSEGKAGLRIQSGDGTFTVWLDGEWTVDHAAGMEAALDAVAPPPGVSVVFRPGDLRQLDLTGAWLVNSVRERLQAAGHAVELDGFRTHHFRFLDSLPPQPETPSPARTPAWRRLLLTIGRTVVSERRQIQASLGYLGRLVVNLLGVLLRPQRLRIRDISHHMYETGIMAIPIVSLIAFLISIVLAYQGASQLAHFGATVYTVDLVTISQLREMGVLLTAIMVAGRSGSAFAAQIGFMKINEEVDALRTMGFEPYEILVVPRVIALVLVLPLLTVLADLMGLIGGALLSVFTLDMSLHQYYLRAVDAAELNTFLVGLIKAPVFAFLIGFIGTMRGLQVSGSAESVGRQTTNAVVQSIFMVIVADAVFSILFSWLEF